MVSKKFFIENDYQRDGMSTLGYDTLEEATQRASQLARENHQTYKIWQHVRTVELDTPVKVTDVQ